MASWTSPRASVDDLAHLLGHLAGKLLFAGKHDLADAIENLAAFGCRVESPFCKGPGGGIDCPLHIGGSALNVGGNRFTRRGI